MKTCLFVDANLKKTSSPRLRKAVVNRVNGCFEITFLKPIAHNKTESEVYKEKGKWGSRYFPSYACRLPRAESCIKTNASEKSLLFKNCLTSSDYTDWHGRREFGYALDENGRKTRAIHDIYENVYVSVLLTDAEFYALNPNLNLHEYVYNEVI